MTPLAQLTWTQYWQVTAVAAVVGLFVTICCRQRPHLAYVLWLVVIIKCLTPPLWSSPTSLFSWAGREPGVTGPGAPAPLDAAFRGPPAVADTCCIAGRYVAGR